MGYATNSTAQEAMWGGFIPFGLCTFWGLRLLLRGLRGDIADPSGTPVASRTWFIIGGMVLQAPLIGYTLFVWRQGLGAGLHSSLGRQRQGVIPRDLFIKPRLPERFESAAGVNAA